MSTIDRLFDAKRRAPTVELAPAASPPAPVPVASPAVIRPEPSAAPPVAHATVDHRRDDSATVEVIGSFAGPVLLADDELIDVFGGLAGSASVSRTTPLVAAVVPVPEPVSIPIPIPTPIAPQVTSTPALTPVSTPVLRPRSRWVDIASHAVAVVLICCAVLVIAHRLRVPLPGLPRAVPLRAAAPAAAELPDASATAADPAPALAAAVDPAPVAVDSPAPAPATTELPSGPRRLSAHPSVAPVAPLVAAADAAPAAQATGTVLLAISPWGEVLVDGVGRGVTPPLDRIALAPGSYRFEVRNPAAPRYSATLEVRAGESVTLQHHF